jgi:hypothetical protein
MRAAASRLASLPTAPCDDLHEHRRHRTRAAARRAHHQRGRPAPATIVVNRVVQRRCDPPRPASRAAAPAEERTSTQADTETERTLDRQLQEVIDQEIPARAQP